VKKLLAAAAIALMTIISGCSTPSLGLGYRQAITKEKVARIKIGETTRDKLNEMFGEPEMKVLTSDGVTYFYKDLNLNSLWAVFDDEWILRDYEWSK